MRLISIACILLLASAGGMAGQGRAPRQQKQRGGSVNPNDRNAALVLPNFSGLLKVIDKKFVLLESEDGNTQKINITRKTRFFDGEKAIAAADLKEGDKVSAEVQIAPDRTFDGVNIRVEKKN